VSGKFVVWMVNFHSSELVEKSISSLPPALCETIIVLDNSDDREEWARLLVLQAMDQRVVLHRSSSNVGFGAAMNRIAKLAPGDPDDLIWLLNPDTEVLAVDPVDVVRALQDGFAIVSPVIVQGRTAAAQRIWFNGGTVDTERGIVEHLRFGAELSTEDQGVRRTEFMTGAAPIMFRETFEQLGGFDERFFLYWEDVDLSLRATAAGLRMAVTPSSKVWHLEGGSGEGAAGHSRVYYRYMARNRLIVSRLHGSSLATLLVGAGARETLKIIVRPLIHERSGRAAKAAAALLGSLEGAWFDVGARK
jgi:N-acetylglucosaminyl-diphospho-decaprenol L-rhamnosyltransferase